MGSVCLSHGGEKYLRARRLAPISGLPEKGRRAGWGLGFQDHGGQAGMSTGLVLLHLTCPLAEGGAAKFSGSPGAQACPCLQSPLTLLPPNWQTPPSWCDPRAPSTACSFRRVRLPAPHPGPHQSYPPLLFKVVQPTQIYMFVCLPVCLSLSLPIPVSQLPFLSHSFS